MEYFLAPFHALGYLQHNKYLWRYALIPASITLIIVGVSTRFIVRWAREMLLEMFGGTAIWTMALSAIITLVLMVVAFYVFVVLLNLISGPFNELLAARVMQKADAHPADERALPWRALLQEYRRTIVAEVLRAGFFIGISLFVLAVSFAVPPLSILWAPVGLFFLVFEFTEYALGLQRRSLWDKLAFAGKHWMPCLLFGLGLSLFLTIPILNLVFIPVAVVAGTQVVLRLEPRA